MLSVEISCFLFLRWPWTWIIGKQGEILLWILWRRRWLETSFPNIKAQNIKSCKEFNLNFPSNFSFHESNSNPINLFEKTWYCFEYDCLNSKSICAKTFQKSYSFYYEQITSLQTFHQVLITMVFTAIYLD